MRYTLVIIVCMLIGCKSSIPDPNTEDISNQGLLVEDLQKDLEEVSEEIREAKEKERMWMDYYESGSMKSIGKYELDTYTNCCFAGPCEQPYSYKVGLWIYYHENGKVAAEGRYEVREKHIPTSCQGGDEINYGYTNDTWKFFDENGKPCTIKNMDKAF